MKKSLSAIFCLVIMLSLSVPVSASAFDSSNYASSNSSAVAQSQYEMLMDSFGFDSSLSDIVYPSNYGGAYINSEGALVVMQTNSISSSSRGGNFASVLNEAGSFILDTVSYSYNELNSLKSEIDDACLSFQSNPSAFSDDQANLLNSISFFYISQKDNCKKVLLISMMSLHLTGLMMLSWKRPRPASCLDLVTEHFNRIAL